MFGTDPLPSARISGAGAAPEDPRAATIATVHDLYSACHLPGPVVVVAPSAVEFARSVAAVAGRREAEFFMLSMWSAFAAVLVAIGVRAVVRLLMGEPSISAADAAFIVSLAAAGAATFALVLRYPWSRAVCVPLTVGYGAAAVLGALAGLAIGGGAVPLVTAALAVAVNICSAGRRAGAACKTTFDPDLKQLK